MRDRQSHTQRRPGFCCAPSGLRLLMLAVIDKEERENLSKAERNELRMELAGYVDDYRASVKAKVARMKKEEN